MRCKNTINLRPTKDGLIPQVPCSQCLNCRLNRRDKWVTRCLLESRSASVGQFWTLTFSDEGLKALDTLGAKKLRNNFSDSLRTHERRLGNPLPIRSFGALEYGDLTGRPHFHLLIWNHINNWRTETPYRPGLPSPRWHIPHWPHGHVDVQPLKPKSARYVCKYVTKFEMEGQTEPTVFHTKKPPLGYAGLASLVATISNGPTRDWIHPTAIELDGKKWPLDQTMLRLYSTLMRKANIRHERQTLRDRQDQQIMRYLRDYDTGWQKAWEQEKKERTRDRAFQRTKDARQLRQFSIWSRALSFSQDAQPTLTSQNASKTA